MNLIQQLAGELKLGPSQVEAAVQLMDQGNTIPFIARYRKEVTGSLDDTQLRQLEERLSYLRGLEKRKEEVSASIEKQGAMTEELARALAEAATLAQVEDLYRPYKPKRRTRASIAREKGLEPLAQALLEQRPGVSPENLAQPFVNPQQGVADLEEALAGASDIIAEWVSDRADIRGELREYLLSRGVVHSQAATKEDSVYANYYDFSQGVAAIAGHRVLAIDRGEREGKLKVSIEGDPAVMEGMVLTRTVKKRPSPSGELVKAAALDALDRLIFPSVEREIRSQLTAQATDAAIEVFALNLRPLLLAAPVKGKVALGLDPAYRTGCKIAVVDPTGKVLDTTVIYPTPPQNRTKEAGETLTRLIEKYQVSVIAIGNGTASRESEIFVANLLPTLKRPVSYLVVSEAGASVYSASKLGAEEFPQYDVSLRSAVSIARRLQDPLAELVKIDPKAIGVGQYQHDMPPAKLDSALGGVVEDCVNSVGVDVNTASWSLLSYVAGIGPALAKNIVAYREAQGHFTSRKQLLAVPKLGKKAFEQAAGFLRVAESDNPLDNTAVHPESYPAAKELLTLWGYTPQDLKEGGIKDLKQKTAARGYGEVAQTLGIGVPTLTDMVEELLRPGRDPRDTLPPPLLRTDLLQLSDLKPGMVLEGTVRNVVDFGAFVDIGVHQDGLVHISRLCDRYIRHPSQVVQVGQIVRVRVLEVDPVKKRIALTMRDLEETATN